MMEHGLGVFGRVNLHPGRNPLGRQYYAHSTSGYRAASRADALA